MIQHKIEPSTPDDVCEECSQYYRGECRAMCIPHSQEEQAARTTEYGMECDPPRLKKLRARRFNVKYHTGEVE